MSLFLSTFRPPPSTVGLSAIWNSMPSRSQRNRHTQCLIVLPDAPFGVMTYLNIPANMTFVLNWVGKKNYGGYAARDTHGLSVRRLRRTMDWPKP